MSPYESRSVPVLNLTFCKKRDTPCFANLIKKGDRPTTDIINWGTTLFSAFFQTYSQNDKLSFAEQFVNLKSVAESNQMFLRIASNDFFAASKSVVQKMITREYNAQNVQVFVTKVCPCLSEGN